MFLNRMIGAALLAALVVTSNAADSSALTFTTGINNGGTFGNLYGQGFSPSINPSPNPAPATTASLDSVEFYVTGEAQQATNVQVAIISNWFYDWNGALNALPNHIPSSAPAFVGVSDTVLTPAGANGDAITFDFSGVELNIADNYGAVFVNDNNDGTFSPVKVRIRRVNTPGGVPIENYGTDNGLHATSSFINANGFFQNLSNGADANFLATLTAVPEPASLMLVGVAASGLLVSRRRVR